jgi:uncharacterized protein YdeI (YjbR/CyaY-like superfamily)
VAEPIFFASPAAWREWLEAHHDQATECLVGFVKVTTGEATMTWPESVDQALCFGWIDGVRRRIDDRSYSIRFTPRKPTSIWSTVNVAKIEALDAAGLLTAAGRAAYERRSAGKSAVYSYEREASELSETQLATFAAQPEAWAFWQAQAASYRRTATHWATTAKREETRERRFARLLADSAAGKRLGHLSRP